MVIRYMEIIQLIGFRFPRVSMIKVCGEQYAHDELAGNMWAIETLLAGGGSIRCRSPRSVAVGGFPFSDTFDSYVPDGCPNLGCLYEVSSQSS